MTTELIGRSGLTFRQWEDARIADYVAGRRKTLSEPWAYEREFLADADGCVEIEKICNAVTGEWVTLPEALRVYVDDLGRVIAECQARFLTEWQAAHPPGARRGFHGEALHG